LVKLKCGRTFLIRGAGQQDGIFWWAEASRFATIETMKTTRLILLASLALIPCAFAVDPPPDGGYPNGNTAEGEDALFTGGSIGANTAIGYHALYSDDFGASNTAVGSNALYSTHGAYFNTGVGAEALSSDTDAGYNTAVGYSALNGISGFAHSDNVAIGYRAMANGDAYFCVAVGSPALENNKGQLNTALGKGAMQDNTSGSDNTACGWSALVHNLSGFNNTAIGLNSLANNASGNGNIGLGNDAGINLTSGSNNIDIGNQGLAGESSTLRLGTEGTQTATYIAGIRTSPLAVATGVGITADGQLGVRASSARYKEAIRPMAKASEAILSLRPVTFRYKKELDPKATPQFGLVAEEVASVDPNLVARDASGKPFTVRYDEVNAMLLNEFLKEHRKVEEQGAEIAELRSALKEQGARLKKVSERLESAALAPRLVENR
jgi:hypothetical protein